MKKSPYPNSPPSKDDIFRTARRRSFWDRRVLPLLRREPRGRASKLGEAEVEVEVEVQRRRVGAEPGEVESGQPADAPEATAPVTSPPPISAARLPSLRSLEEDERSRPLAPPLSASDPIAFEELIQRIREAERQVPTRGNEP